MKPFQQTSMVKPPSKDDFHSGALSKGDILEYLVVKWGKNGIQQRGDMRMMPKSWIYCHTQPSMALHTLLK